MKGPFLLALAAGLLSLLIAFAPAVWRMIHPAAPAAAGPAPDQGAPWQVALPAPGASRVFGLRLPGSHLADVQQRWSETLELALITHDGATPALEAYVERFEAAGVAGRLLLVFDAEAALLARLHATLPPGEPLPSGGRRQGLRGAAAAELGGAALVGLSFIPAAQLDAQILQARFGAPAERLAGGGRLEHWLYPALGLAVVLDAGGRDVLQYTAPADFERRLVAPLRAAGAAR